MAGVPDQKFWAKQLEITKNQREENEKLIDHLIAQLEDLLKNLLCKEDAFIASGALDRDKFQFLERRILMDHQRLWRLQLIGEEQSKLIRYLTPLAALNPAPTLAGK